MHLIGRLALAAPDKLDATPLAAPEAPLARSGRAEHLGVGRQPVGLGSRLADTTAIYIYFLRADAKIRRLDSPDNRLPCRGEACLSGLLSR